eukprot:4213617-Heterocapsa_arctica.AAC.1
MLAEDRLEVFGLRDADQRPACRAVAEERDGFSDRVIQARTPVHCRQGHLGEAPSRAHIHLNGLEPARSQRCREARGRAPGRCVSPPEGRT